MNPTLRWLVHKHLKIRMSSTALHIMTRSNRVVRSNDSATPSIGTWWVGIDRSQTLSFVFDGRSYVGHPGDTLASALLANGVSVVGRSFKYHRPRGILTASVNEPNALVTRIDGPERIPNVAATTLMLTPGLRAESQNRWPSLKARSSGDQQPG